MGTRCKRALAGKNPQTISGSTYKQFKAYIKSKREFQYYFNGNANQMKLKFQDVFKDADKVEELWKLNQDFFKKMLGDDIDSFEEVLELANQGKLIEYFNWIN